MIGAPLSSKGLDPKKLKAAARGACCLCGAPASWAGLYVPEPDRSSRLPVYMARHLFYGVCEACAGATNLAASLLDILEPECTPAWRAA